MGECSVERVGVGREGSRECVGGGSVGVDVGCESEVDMREEEVREVVREESEEGEEEKKGQVTGQGRVCVSVRVTVLGVV